MSWLLLTLILSMHGSTMKLIKTYVKKCESRAWIGFIVVGASGMFGEDHNKASHSIKCLKCVD